MRTPLSKWRPRRRRHDDDMTICVESYLLRVIRGERKGPVPAALRSIFALLSYVYSAGLKLFLLPFRLGIRRQTRLAAPVISIGNLTVGGTGKTSMTQRVCE